MKTIINIERIEPYKLTLKFSDNSILTADLEEKIISKSTTKKSKFRELLDFENFRKVKLHPEWETVYWPNGIDLCLDQLYRMSRETIESLR